MVLGRLYIIRNQNGDRINCTSAESVADTKRIAAIFRSLNVKRVIARQLAEESFHLRPLQSAANICAHMKLDLELVVASHEIPSNDIEDILVVWNRDEVNELISRFGILGQCAWPIDNYSGCVIIDASGWRFAAGFLDDRSHRGCCVVS